MGRAALRPSPAIAELLRFRREELGFSLRDVEAKTAEAGERIHFATLARVEQGKVEIGINRLHKLLKLYDLPLPLASDLLELEALKGATPGPMPLDLLGAKGLEFWQKGDFRRGLAHLFALRRRAVGSSSDRLARQRSLLAMAVAAGSLGRLALSKYVVEGLLVEPPEPRLLVRTLAQAAVCWHGLGSTESALGYLGRAEAHLGSKDHVERAWLLHEKASVLVDVGDLDGAEAAAREAVSAYRRVKDAYGEGRVVGVRLKILAQRGEWTAALKDARAAKREAVRHRHSRLVAARSLDEARALLGLRQPADALAVLKEALSWAIQEDDRVVRFYAHYYLWKAYEAEGDAARAEAERRSAEEHVGFVDELTPETQEFRDRADRAAMHGEPSLRRPR